MSPLQVFQRLAFERTEQLAAAIHRAAEAPPDAGPDDPPFEVRHDRPVVFLDRMVPAAFPIPDNAVEELLATPLFSRERWEDHFIDAVAYLQRQGLPHEVPHPREQYEAHQAAETAARQAADEGRAKWEDEVEWRLENAFAEVERIVRFVKRLAGEKLDEKEDAGPAEQATAEPLSRQQVPKWQQAAKRLEELRSQGEPFTSQRELAKRLKVAPATVNRAAHSTPDLHKWSGARNEGQAAPKVQGLSDAVTDRTPQKSELSPVDEAAIREFVEKADEDTKSWFEGLPVADQLQHLNDTDAHGFDESPRSRKA